MDLLRGAPLARALALLLCSAAPAPSAAQELFALRVEDLGAPLMLAGPGAALSIRAYADQLIGRGVFPRLAQEIAAWASSAASKVEPLSLDGLRARGPLIGIQLNSVPPLVGHWGDKKNARNVAEALGRAGGVPLFLSPVDAEPSGRALLGQLDHLVLPGGADVHPDLYGEPIDGARYVNRERDLHGKHVIAAALERGLDITGICRGMQELCVALGGSLVQDLGAQGVTVADHTDARHDILLDPEGWLARATGQSAMRVVSRHHQAIRRMPPGMRCVARSGDNVVEAMIGLDGRVRGVQFHPEDSPESPACEAIFRHVVELAARAAQARRATGRSIMRGAR